MRTAPEYSFLGGRLRIDRMAREALDFTNAVAESPADTLLFLDKSARPVSWMFRDIWDGIYPESDRPEIKFANIGLEKATMRQGESRPGSLADHFGVPKSDGTYIDGRRIMIVDDYAHSGKTLQLAKKMIQESMESGDDSEIMMRTVFSRPALWWDDELRVGVSEQVKSQIRVNPIRPPSPESLELRHDMGLLAAEAIMLHADTERQYLES